MGNDTGETLRFGLWPHWLRYDIHKPYGEIRRPLPVYVLVYLRHDIWNSQSWWISAHIPNFHQICPAVSELQIREFFKFKDIVHSRARPASDTSRMFCWWVSSHIPNLRSIGRKVPELEHIKILRHIPTLHVPRATFNKQIGRGRFYSRQKECGYPRKKTAYQPDMSLLGHKPLKSLATTNRSYWLFSVVFKETSGRVSARLSLWNNVINDVKSILET